MANPQKHDHVFKILIIGDAGCGKTCLLKYFLERKFKKGITHTIGIEFGSKVLTVGGKQIRLQIWDTAGQDRFRGVTRNYYRGAMGCLLVYDITSRDSYNHLMSWLNGARTYAHPDIQVVLVGNKSDLRANREVTLLEASRFAQENDLLFLETSAVTGECVDEVFIKLTASVLEKVNNGAIVDEPSPNTVDPSNQAAAVSGCRC